MEQTEQQIVDKFARDMYLKIALRHNRYKPLGWKTMDMKRLISLLEGELAELKEAYTEGDGVHIADEAVDVANYAMFIYELSRNKT